VKSFDFYFSGKYFFITFAVRKKRTLWLEYVR